MEDVRQVLRFEGEGIDQISDGLDALATNFTKVEKAKDAALSDIADKAQQGNKALIQTTETVNDTTAAISRQKTIIASSEKQVKSFSDRFVDLGNKATKNFNDLINKGKEFASAVGKRITDATDNIQLYGVKLGDVRKGFGKAISSVSSWGRAAGAAGSGAAKSLGLVRVAAIAANAALGLIGVVFALLAAAASRSQAALDKFAVVTAQVTAVIDVVLDRAGKFVDVLVNLWDGDFTAAANNYAAATAGIGDELEREIRLAKELTIVQQQLDREAINLDVRRAAANARLKELNFTIEDQTKAYDERRGSAIEFAEIESKLLNDEIALQERQLAQMFGLTEVTDEFRAKLVELGNTGFVFEELGNQANDLSITMEDIGISTSTLSDVEAFGQQFAKLQEVSTRSLEVQTTNNNKLVQLERERAAKIQAAIAEQRKAEEDLFNFQKQIADQLSKLAIDNSEGAERIELERQVAQAQIDELEKVAREKFKAAKQEFNLTAEFAELRSSVERDAADRTAAYRLEVAKESINEERDRQLAQLELSEQTGAVLLDRAEFLAGERTRILRESLERQREIAVNEFGEDSLQVLTIDVQLRATEDATDDLTEKVQARVRAEALDAINVRQEIRLAEAELIQKSEEANLDAAQFREKKKTEILIDGLLERRKLLLDQFGADAPEVKLVDLEIEGMQQKIDGLDNLKLDVLTRIRNRIQEVFNLDDATTDLLVEQARGAFENVVTALEQVYERQLVENQKLIDQIDSRIEVLEGSLEEELEKREQGFANNAEVIQAQLDDENERRDKAEQKRLAIEKKAAQQRLIIDGIQKASAYGLAVANLVAAEAFKGIAAIITIGAGIAAIFAFAATARAQAAQFSEVPQLRDGGDVFAGLLVGPNHESGGVDAYYQSPEGRRVISLEGDEFVTSKKQTSKHRELLTAINDDRIGSMTDGQVLDLVSRNPSVGISERMSGYRQDKSSDVSRKELGDMIATAIKKQTQIVSDGKGNYYRIDPSGIMRPTKNPLP